MWSRCLWQGGNRHAKQICKTDEVQTALKSEILLPVVHLWIESVSSIRMETLMSLHFWSLLVPHNGLQGCLGARLDMQHPCKNQQGRKGELSKVVVNVKDEERRHFSSEAHFSVSLVCLFVGVCDCINSQKKKKYQFWKGINSCQSHCYTRN